MIADYILFFCLMCSLCLCLYLFRKLRITTEENIKKLRNTSAELLALAKVLEESNNNIDEKIDELDNDFLEDAENDYSKMAEQLACIHEEEMDRIRDDLMLQHIEEDCDQCCQDGPDKCEVNNLGRGLVNPEVTYDPSPKPIRES